MPREKKYTPEALGRAVRKYFKTISREKKLTEMLPTGERDSKGHMILEESVVKNALGEEMTVTEYLVPPTVGDLSAYLGIHRDTWNAYCNDPAFSDTTTYARGRMEAYLERELLTRAGKDIKGIQFQLENNYGYKERVAVENDSMEAYLQAAAEEMGKCRKL